MSEARKDFYYDKIKSFENENSDVPMSSVNKWVKLGNLIDRNFDDLPNIYIRV